MVKNCQTGNVAISCNASSVLKMGKVENNLPSSLFFQKDAFRRVVQCCISRRCGWRRFFLTRIQLAPWWHRFGLAASGIALLGLAFTLLAGATPSANVAALFFGVLGSCAVCTGMLGRGVPVVDFLRLRGVPLHAAAAEFEKSLEECGVLTDASGAAERMVRFVFLKG
jgi:hypothetical protein